MPGSPSLERARTLGRFSRGEAMRGNWTWLGAAAGMTVMVIQFGSVSQAAVGSTTPPASLELAPSGAVVQAAGTPTAEPTQTNAPSPADAETPSEARAATEPADAEPGSSVTAEKPESLQEATDASLPTPTNPSPSGTGTSDTPPVHDPRATIGEFDCTALTVTVTLDNTRSTEVIGHIVDAGRDSVISGYHPVLRDKLVEVGAGATEVVRFPVIDHAEYVVAAQTGRILLLDRVYVDCAPRAKHDARVTYAPFDCASRTLPVSLDNTHSDEAVIFAVGATHEDEDGNPHLDYFAYFEVAIGAIQLIHAPLPATDETVTVSDTISRDHRIVLATARIQFQCPATQPAPRPTPPVVIDQAEDATTANAGLLPRAPGPRSLPATGGFNTALPLSGVALLWLGVLALFLGRRATHH